MADWIVLKIFTKGLYSDPNYLQNVFSLRDICLPALSSLAGKNEYYFLHYAHPVQTPEGPHFKFFVKTKNASPFIQWKRANRTRKEIERIERHSGKHDANMNEGSQAREVFDRVRNIGKKNLVVLNAALKIDSIYPSLSDNELIKGKHFLRNMLQMTYAEESIFNALYNQ